MRDSPDGKLHEGTKNSSSCTRRTYLLQIARNISGTGSRRKTQELLCDRKQSIGKAVQHICCLFQLRNGATTKQLLVFLRSLGWAKCLYLAEIYIPHPQKLLIAHWSSLRQALHSMDRTSRHVLQREVGLLYNPVWWVLKQVVTTVHCTANALEEGDRRGAVWMHLQRRKETPYYKSVEALFKTFRLTWEEVAGSESPTLRREKQLVTKAKEEYLSWASQQTRQEARRHGTWKKEDPVWRLERKVPKYHSLPEGRYGFLHRLPQFNPPPTPPQPCPFCAKSRADNGLHLAKECRGLPSQLHAEREDLKKELGGWEALRLSSSHVSLAFTAEWKKTHPQEKPHKAEVRRYLYDALRSLAG